MKVHKTITEKVLAANRRNAQKSSGPNNVDAVKQNACTHGLLSKNLRFQNEQEKLEFEEMLSELQADQNASGLLERILVEEAASSVWKLRKTEDWDFKELMNRRGAAKAVLQAVAENNDDEQILLSNYGGEAVQHGWDCQELVIRTDSRNADENDKEEDLFGGTQKKSRLFHMEAKLANSLDTVMRYRIGNKKEGYVQGHFNFARDASCAGRGRARIMSTSNKHRHHHSRNDHARLNKRPLSRAMKRHLVGPDASRVAGLQLIKLLARVDKMHHHIDAAYAGQPFLLDIPPDAPPNRKRFKAFVDSHARAMKLFGQVIELWMLVFGMKKEDNWTPLLTERMRQAAARSMFEKFGIKN